LRKCTLDPNGYFIRCIDHLLEVSPPQEKDAPFFFFIEAHQTRNRTPLNFAMRFQSLMENPSDRYGVLPYRPLNFYADGLRADSDLLKHLIILDTE
jgi:hypothetical protein